MSDAQAAKVPTEATSLRRQPVQQRSAQLVAEAKYVVKCYLASKFGE